MAALAEAGKLEVLSRPSILARNNQEAVIVVGEEVPFVTNSRITVGMLATAGLDPKSAITGAMIAAAETVSRIRYVLKLASSVRRPRRAVSTAVAAARLGVKTALVQNRPVLGGNASSEVGLLMAGADRVVAPQQVGAERLAALVLNRDTAEFIDLMIAGRFVEFRVAEFRISATSPFVGQSLRDLNLRAKGGAMVIAVGRAKNQLDVNPDPSTIFQPGQVVVAVGSQNQLDALKTLATTAESRT